VTGMFDSREPWPHGLLRRDMTDAARRDPQAPGWWLSRPLGEDVRPRARRSRVDVPEVRR
jgi:hypothetical protein